jgi:uncharacterized membrane protein
MAKGPVPLLAKVGVAIAIVVMYVLFVVVGTNTFLQMPQYEKICPVALSAKTQPLTEESCVQEGGMWQSTAIGAPPGESVPATDGYCDFFIGCQQQYEAQMEDYAPKAFTVMVIAGIVGIVVSFFIAVESISMGLLIGGVLLVLGSTVAFWSQVNDIVRFVIIGAVLAFLIALGWIKTRDKSKP